MNIFKFTTKLIAQILFVIIFFSTLDAKNLDKFDEESHISDYFSGILLLNDNQYNESYKFLKKLEGLEESHDHYSSKYLFSLVNLGKFNEAFSYSKKLEKRKLGNFESNLIMGIYYLKNQNYDLAKDYFLKLRQVFEYLLLFPPKYIFFYFLDLTTLKNLHLDSLLQPCKKINQLNY